MADYLNILSFDPFNTNPSSSQVDIFVRSHRDITSWFYPYVGTYYFRSSRAVADLIPSFKQFFGISQFSISFVIPTTIGGSLPENVWTWVNTGSVTSLPEPK